MALVHEQRSLLLTKFFVLFFVVLIANGCVAIPISASEEEPFRDEVTDFIVANVTSRSDIRTSLGNPSKSFLNGRIWVFDRTQKDSEWLVIWGAGYIGGIDFVGGEVQHHYLMVAFNTENVVTHSTLNRPSAWCIQELEMCLIDGLLVLEGATAASALDPVGLCYAVLFTTRKAYPFRAIWVKVDAQENMTAFLDDDTRALYIPLTPGSHRLNVSVNFEDGTFLTDLNTLCSPPATHYLSLKLEDSVNTTLRAVSTTIGQMETRDRRMVIMRDLMSQDDN